jgi:hypothetical protein
MPKPTSQSPAVSAAHSAIGLARSGPKWRMQVTMPRSVMPKLASARSASSRIAAR